MENKNYLTCSLLENPDIFEGYYNNFFVKEDILSKLSRDLGFSYDMYVTLSNIDINTARSLVVSMSKKSKHTEISLLVDSNVNEVLGYTLEFPRVPLLNEEFMKRVQSLVETCKDISIVEKYILKEDTISSVVIKKLEPIELDLGSKKVSYNIGVLVVNNELDSTYGRLVIFIEDQPYYLPASYYSITTNRYKRSTNNSAEALEVLMLKVIEDLREDELKYKLADFHLIYSTNVNTIATYEEYNTVLRAMMKIPSIIEDRSPLESLSAKYLNFEQRYAQLDSKKSSYIWRCTAVGDLDIGSLVHITSSILKEVNAPSIEYFNIRELIGTYISTKRIASEIAK